MKKKNVALVLAAVMVMSGTAQTMAVSAAAFSDGEVFAEELFEEPEISDEAFGDFAMETEVFEDGEGIPAAALITQAAPVMGWSITKEEFEAWCNGEDLDTREKEPTEGTTEDIFDKLSHETGYAAIGFPADTEDFTDLVIPEDLNVAILGWAQPKLNSIIPDGNVVIEGGVQTPGALEIKEGKGSVTFKDAFVQGMLYGSGKNDTVRFSKWNHIGGLKGVENAVFINPEEQQFLNINEGPAEFYNISQENMDGKNVNINIQGYSKNKIPVFHNSFDLGSIQRSDDEGNTWTDPGCVGVCYIENFDVPAGKDWNAILPKHGAQFVKFAATDAEIADMIGKMYQAWDIGEKRAAIEFDGTIFFAENEDAFYHVQTISDSEGVSAAEAFDRYAQAEFPDSCFEWKGRYSTIETVEKVMNADKDGSGYYKVDLPKAAAFDRLTVPNGAKGVIYQVRTDYDEASDTEIFYDTNIKALHTPAGKTMKINSYKAPSGTLTISGTGDTQFFGSRINQNVTAEGTVTMQWSTVKSLTCDTLRMKESWMMVEDTLKFKQASILNSDIFAKSGAKLQLGAIDNTGTQMGEMALNLEVKNGAAPEVYFAKPFQLGDVIYEGEEPRDARMDMNFYDYAKMASAGSNTVKDMYSEKFDAWNEDETKNFYYHLIDFNNEAKALVNFSKEAIANAQYVMEHFHIRYNGGSLFIEAAEVTDTKAQFYSYNYEKDEVTKTNSYIAIGAPVEIPKKGSRYAIDGLKYKVLTTGSKGGTVMVYGPKKTTYTSITIPSSVKINGLTYKVTTIYTKAFRNNKKLKSVTIGKYVTTIGSYAFYGCSSLKSIKIAGTGLTKVNKDIFKGIYKKAVIKVPSNRVRTYTRLLKGKGQASTVKITK